jgi:hypothetical protein
MVKLLNQEYHNTLDIVDNGWQIKLYWKEKSRFHHIINRSYRNPYNFPMFNFVTGEKWGNPLYIKYYNYSSGLNHPNAYQ